ncbi:hypothetical protein BKA70DRAFT_1272857 [Coprinopsis sp. MPI-PUGE-AT-0042]|nr:hypothetical protein BKA70DRAFT_1272857 [Coprinopsis sp. MPI-PUGE-AT-0042]
MASITNIPHELLLTITERLPRGKDVFALRQVCSSLSETLAPTCLATVVMDSASPAGFNALRTLAGAAEQQHPVTRWARTLVIKSFQTDQDALVWMETVFNNLKGIKCLEWLQKHEYRRTSDKLPEKTSTTIVTLLEPLVTSLAKVDIYNFRGFHVTLLNGLSQLSRLCLSVNSPSSMYGGNYSRTLEDHIYKSVRGAIHRSSDTLESLELCIPRWESSSSPIQELLEDTNPRSFPRLTLLSLEICSGQLEKTLKCTLPSPSRQFSSLQALHLTGRLSLDTTNMPPESDNIFTVLENSGIHLVEINSQCICEPLIRYLLSYRNTVQQLTIEDADRTYSNLELAADLNEILLQHKSSLRNLTIAAARDNGWAVGDNNMELLTIPVPALEALSVSVFVSSNGTEEINDYLVSAQFLSQTCLDRALESASFPLLRHIYIDTMVEPARGLSGRRCGNYIMRLRKLRFEEALRRLSSYRFTSNTIGEAIHEAQLPVIYIGHQCTRPFHRKEGWQYRTLPDPASTSDSSSDCDSILRSL